MIFTGLAGGMKEEMLFAHGDSKLKTPKVRAIAAGNYRNKRMDHISGWGYVIESLEAAAWCFWQTSDFQAAVLAAVNLGDDADTTGAVVGQIAAPITAKRSFPRNGWRSW